MKIAIHKSSWGFSKDWISFCDDNRIDYKIVNCYDNNISDQINDCDAVLWHYHHSIINDVLFAKQFLFAAEQAGKKVFPDFNTGWHFDDKLGQKYLLELLKVPFAKTWLFYNPADAEKWASEAGYPKVFKLRGGAGSSNVRLVKTKNEAIQLINKAFGRGFSLYNKWSNLSDNYVRFKNKKTKTKELVKSIIRLFISTKYSRTFGKQRGYILFQEFMPGNEFDIRVVTIGDRACGLRRLVRKNDFRASGSGLIQYEKELIDEECVKIAFETTRKLKAQCVAYDFVYDLNKKPVIVEINYGFAHEAYFKCPGYWDKKINWHEGEFNLAFWIMEEILKSGKNNQ